MLIQPTPITSLDRVDFVGSPKHISTSGVSYSGAILKLWIWTGNLNYPYINNLEPTLVFTKDKVSSADAYVSFEVGDIIKDYINPSAEFTPTSTAVSGEGVFYQYELQTYVYGGGSPIIIGTNTASTRFATAGYNWNYEGEAPFTYNHGSFGFVDTDVKKYYSPYVSYYTSKINLSGATTSNGMVVRESAQYSYYDEKCASDPYVILYLAKTGLWDTFTPTGKVTISNKMDREQYSRPFRKPITFNPKFDHETIQYNINGKQSYDLNTGQLTPEMGQLVEEILLSPKVYLINFTGDLTAGSAYTVDNTVITVDSTLITVDASTGRKLYTGFRHIPVIVTDTDFVQRTKLNNRNKINYNLRFEEAQTKINNIR